MYSYSWPPLSRTRLSRTTAYLEVKIWSLLKNENLITGNKILWKTYVENIVEKRRNCSLGAISPLFHNIFNICLTSRVQLHIHLFNAVVRFIVFLTLSTLICRGTDISKCFIESLGIRDNESRMYLESWYITHYDILEPPIGQLPFYIMKTRLFKYIENFTTKNENFQIKILIFFKFLLKT